MWEKAISTNLWCTTKFENQKHEFTWTIEDFSLVKSMPLISAKFPQENTGMSFVLQVKTIDDYFIVRIHSSIKDDNLSQNRFRVNLKVGANPKWSFTHWGFLDDGLVFSTVPIKYDDLLSDIDKNLRGNNLIIHCVIHVLTGFHKDCLSSVDPNPERCSTGAKK